MIQRGCRFNEANDANANEAEVTNKPAEADEAEAYEANNAKANEADMANVSNEFEANVIGKIIAADEANVIDKVVAVNEANVAVDEANDTIKANDSNNAIVANKANEANEAIVASEADDSDNEADGVLDNQLTELEKLDKADEAV